LKTAKDKVTSPLKTLEVKELGASDIIIGTIHPLLVGDTYKVKRLSWNKHYTRLYK